jgi:exodeoxyribonuclease VII large subunit
MVGLQEKLARAIVDLLRVRRFTLARLAERVNALSPLSTLKRGYAVPLDDDGKVLRTTSDFSPGQAFHLRVLDGRIQAETKGVQPEEVDADG